MRPVRVLALTLLPAGCFSPAHTEPTATDAADDASTSADASSSDADGSASGGTSSATEASDATASGSEATTADTSSDGGTSEDGSSSSGGETPAVCGDGVVAPGELCFDDITLVDGPDVMYSGRLADLDGDGDRDVVYLIGDGVLIHQGVGDGTFGPGLGGGDIVAIAAEIGDVDGDGHTDLVGVNEYDLTMSIKRGDGNGGFDPYGETTLFHEPSHVLVTQLDRDAGDEIIVGTALGVEVFRSDGDTTPQPGYGFGLGGPIHAMGLGEFDGDGDTDLVYVYEAYGEQRLNVRLGGGDGGFGSAITIDAAGDLPRGVAGGDLDGDGHGDLVYVDVDLAQVFVQRGNGAGGFADPVGFATDEDPRHTLVLDLTADAVPDVVVGHEQGQSLWVYAGTGDGGLQAPLQIPLAGPVYSLAAGLANDDAIPDLVATDGNAQRISIVLSNP